MSASVNETKKTGLFWAAAGVSLAVAAMVAWPSASRDESGLAPLINTDLFAEFEDPLSAASMKIVTFDEEQGKLATFEVRKDRESGAWTIPSRDGYPADAVEQMKDAANSLVGLKILDVQTENVEDHDELGVVEPKLEDLEVGDTGVGRLVTFKDESQKNLASLIIGDAVKDREGQRYVRKPGQDPVYVVALNDAPLTTQFNAWIEDDLLQLSSIDIENVEIKSYNASLGLGGISLSRNYNAKLSMDGSQWSLDELLEYDKSRPNEDPKEVELAEGEKLNTNRLNDLKNALDDLKIADVVRKPKGMSENLRADKELVSDNEAVASLAQRGFIPAGGRDGEVEILSANGEMSVGLKNGVQYVLRFGNVSGLTEEDDEEKEEGEQEPVDGLNRYLLVTTIVDESKFPPPDLQEVPKTLEDLENLLAPETNDEDAEDSGDPDAATTGEKDDDKKDDDKSDDTEAPEELNRPEENATPEDDSKDEPSMKSDNADSDAEPDKGDADEKTAEDTAKKNSEKTEADADKPKSADSNGDSAEESGEVNAEGSGEATVSGQAQQVDEEASDVDAQADKAGDETPEEPSSAQDSDPPGESKSADDPPSKDKADPGDGSESEDEKPKDSDDETMPADKDAETNTRSTTDFDDAIDKSEPVGELDDLTDEEKQERLEAEQEKITKENQRKLDERKDKIEAARRRSAELNARFADWYYVIPESTYGDLRIGRSDLVETESDDETSGSTPPVGGFPGGGFPAGGFPGN